VDMADNLYNIAERFEKRTGEKAGILGDGKFTKGRVTVATFQTFNTKLANGDSGVRSLLLNAGGVVSDEVHVLPADTWGKVMDQATNAWWRLGFSATPLYGEAKRRLAIIGHCGPQIIEVPASELQANGVLAKQTIRMIPFRQQVEGGTYREIYANGIVKSKRRNALLVQLAKRAPKPCHLESAINGGGGRSVKDSLQRLGRILRVTDTKKEVEYWDIDDAGPKHLEKHAKIRREAYGEGGFEVAEVEQSILPGIDL
jgi:superfamily II DNA or RNA helicase